MAINKAIRLMQGQIDSILSWIIPNNCLHCHSPKSPNQTLPLCDDCKDVFWTNTRCSRCGKRCHPSEQGKKRCQQCKKATLAYDQLTSLGPYKDYLRQCIIKVKYEQHPLFTACLRDLSLNFPPPPQQAVFTYLPSHLLRRIQRGTLSQHLPSVLSPWAKSHHIQWTPLIRKNHYRRAQALLNGEERRRSIVGSFDYIGPKPAPKEVWLFDDVTTTGSTLEAACVALRKAGVEHIHCLTFAWSSYE
jgi:predicted amidophosphoribosyltransferase